MKGLVVTFQTEPFVFERDVLFERGSAVSKNDESTLLSTAILPPFKSFALASMTLPLTISSLVGYTRLEHLYHISSNLSLSCTNFCSFVKHSSKPSFVFLRQFYCFLTHVGTTLTKNLTFLYSSSI